MCKDWNLFHKLYINHQHKCSVLTYHSLLVYRNSTDLWILIFVFFNFLDSFILNFVESWRFPMNDIMSSENSGSFTSFQFGWFFFLFLTNFSDETPNTVLNKSGKSWHHYHIPDLRRKTFNFSPLSMTLAVGFSYIAFIRLRKNPYIYIYIYKLSTRYIHIYLYV